MAAREFDFDPKTLAKSVRVAGIVPGEDGKFSTMDMVRAVFGDDEREFLRARTRDTNEAADIKAIKKANLLRENIPADLVEKVWSDAVIDLRQKVLYAEIPDALKQDILRDLQNIPAETYFKTSAPSADEDEDDKAE